MQYHPRCEIYVGEDILCHKHATFIAIMKLYHPGASRIHPLKLRRKRFIVPVCDSHRDSTKRRNNVSTYKYIPSDIKLWSLNA